MTEQLAAFPARNPSPVLLLNADGAVLYANPGATTLLESLGRDPQDASVLLPKAFIEHVTTRQEPHPSITLEYGLDDRTVRCTIVSLPDTGNYHVYLDDITRQARAVHELTHIRKAVEGSSDAVGISDLQGRRTYQNPAFTRMFGYTVEALNAAGGPSAVYADQEVAREVLDTIRNGASWSGEVTMRSRDGRTLSVHLRADAIYDDSHSPIGLIGIYTDITERKRQQDAIRRLAYHDPLTGLPNRAHLHDWLNEALQRVGRLAVLTVDLNNYKPVSYALGQQQGERLLAQVAERLRQTLREDEMLGRIGEDEFAILMAGADVNNADARARTVQERLGPVFAVSGLLLEAPASIGIALCPDHGRDAEALLQRAAVATHMAHRSEVAIVHYDPTHEHSTSRRLALMSDLRRAIENNELALHFQPKMALGQRQLCGVEALVRWTHATHGAVPPDEFVAIAEQTQLIQSLTHWVLDTALRQQSRWRDEGLGVNVAVNLSTRDLHEDLPDTIAGLLDRHGVEPGALTLEVTEGALMSDPALAQEVLQRLADTGLRLAVDDFGTGYSSLAYLQRLPMDELKIDKAFVGKMDDDPGDQVIVRSTVELAHNLGLGVVAEGVENHAVLEMLEALGCEAAQGFYFARPMAGEALASWLRSP